MFPAAITRQNQSIDKCDPGFLSGFRIVDRVLSDHECDELLSALSSKLQRRNRAGARHLMSITEVEAISKDERLLHIVRQTLGPEAIPFRATLFDKSRQANWLVTWHQDTALPLELRIDSKDWGPWSIKAGFHYAHAPAWALSRILALRIHLDASTDENGPLRVIPGSHMEGVLSDDQILEIVKSREKFDCPVARG